MNQTVETVVIGGGIAGLAYAHARGPAADVVVLEASDRPGGLIRTRQFDGGYVECGPEALQGDSEEVQTLLQELRINAVPARASASKRYIARVAPSAAQGVWADRDRLDGKLVAVPSGPGSFFGSPILSAGAKLRLFAEPFRSRDGGLEGSIADFARHRLGPEAAQWLMDPLVSGIYAGDAEQISLRAAFPKVYEMVAQHGSVFRGMMALMKSRPKGEKRKRGAALYTIEGGLERIPKALAESLGKRFRSGVQVNAIQRTAAGWQVTTGADTLQASRVVLAVPARAAATLLSEVAPQLSRSLASMRSESVVSVAHTWPRDRVLHPLDGFGYLVPSCLGLRHLGTLFSSSLNPGRCREDIVLMRTLIGGARHPELVDASKNDVLAIIAAETGAFLGLSGLPLWTHIEYWRDALPRYDLDHPRRLAEIDSTLKSLPGLSMVGNYCGAIAVNGLIETSRRLARSHVENRAAIGAHPS